MYDYDDDVGPTVKASFFVLLVWRRCAAFDELIGLLVRDLFA